MKILVGFQRSEAWLNRIREISPEIELTNTPDRKDVPKAIADVDMFIGWPTSEDIRAAKKLKWIQYFSTGVDTMLKVPELIESDIVVTNVKGAHAVTIAEHTFAMLLSFTRRMREFDADQRKGVWQAPTADKLLTLTGRTMGVVGYGNIGQNIAKRAHAFDMKVVAADAHAIPAGPYASAVLPLDRLSELLSVSDAVVVCVPLTDKSRGMFGGREFAMMKPTAYFLHVSRGGVVDEKALVGALKERRIAGCGIDAFEHEPLAPECELWRMDNVIITPHASAISQHTDEEIVRFIRENIERYLAGKPLINVVDKRLGY